jgi:hypothetical protein
MTRGSQFVFDDKMEFPRLVDKRDVILETNFPGLSYTRSKVRDVYNIEDGC